MKTLFHWSFWALVILAVAFFIYPRKSHADPFIAAEASGVRLVVHTEECALKEVSNLQRRATWTENGKTVEGCAGYYKEIGMILFYWADKTVVAVPASMFARVTGA